MDNHFLFFVIIGFCAQIVDGALGMAYGVINMAMLLSIGIPPVIASASVHIAEVFTTAASGISHAFFKNIKMDLLKRLAIPGMIGAAIGAYLLTHTPVHIIKLCITIYLMLVGCYIIFKVFKYKLIKSKSPETKILVPLGFAGGFFDAMGGGGWGPIVSSSLVALGVQPRYAIGSTNLAEFLVTVTASTTFVFFVGFTSWKIIVGLLVGGIVAAPLAALVAKIIPVKTFMLLVGALIIGLSVRTLIISFIL